ncbi:ATP-binding cassette domain-containing protein [Clostridium sediminicola]|uniref:ABC transporter ATP-binding protein n=1 Tax=Clostridium sediminicola TaxID=3114879 RepID=UPI0031F1E2C7
MLNLKNIHKKFDNLYVVSDLNMSIPNNRIISILGPSGCGKTTILNIIASLIEKDSGEIIGVGDQKISYLFQDPRLIPWKTVYENVEFVLNNKLSKDRDENTICEFLKEVELEEFKDYYPRNLSGGMKQRTALARAFAYPADILLMDEPFKSLDLELRYNLMKKFINMWENHKRTVIFVTHDVQAAVFLSHKIFILSQKPTKVEEEIENTISMEDRYFYNEEFLELEKVIYEKLTKK